MTWKRTEVGSANRSRNSRLVIPPTSASTRSAGGQLVERGPQVVGGQRPYSFSSKTRSRTSRLRLGHLERLAQQVAEEVHLDPAVPQYVGEAVVLGTRAPDPQHVVEEQRVLVRRV